MRQPTPELPALERRAIAMLGLRQPPPSVTSLGGIAEFVASHLTFSGIDALRRDLDLPRAALLRTLAISPRTYERGSKSDRKAGIAVADRALRIARINALAAEVFGGRDAAGDWLSEPQGGLGGRVPNELLASELGAREVEDLLHRIDQGVYV